MKTLALTTLVVAVAVLAFAGGVAFTEDAPKAKPLSMAEMEQKLMQLGQKCPEHDHLQQLVGDWTIAGKAISAAMGEIPISGKVAMTPIWDGRFLRSTYEGPGFPPGTTFHGEGFLGFNRLTGRFQGTWMMSMRTNIELVEGTYDAKEKVFTLTGAMGMPDGSTWTTRQVLAIQSKDKLVESHYATAPGGKETLMVTMTYTRAPAKPTTK